MTSINLQSGWHETTLGEIADIIKDAWKPNDEQRPYIGLEHINEQELTLNGIGNSDGLESNKFRFKSGDILFGKLRPYFRKVVMPNFTGVCSTDIWVIRAKQNHDQKFLFYFMANPVLIDKSMGASTGSRMPRADWNFLEGTHWYVPQQDEQRAIAAVLSSLDDKIELLRNQNKTLEAIARRLFNEWFVEFNFPNSDGKPYKKSGGDMVNGELGEMPEGWRCGKLGEEFDISIGRTPPRGETQWFSDTPTGKKWISIKDIGNSGTYIFNTSEYLTDEAVLRFNVPVIPENTTVLSFKMTVGKLTITTEEMLSNEAIAHLKTKNGSKLTSEFIYCCLQSLDFNSLGSTSSIVTAINSTMIKQIEIVIPDEAILEKFNKAINPLFEKIFNNSSQIQTLSTLRDSLLPRMMNGEMRVKETVSNQKV